MTPDKPHHRGDLGQRKRRSVSPLLDQCITRRMLSQISRPKGRGYAISMPDLRANDVVIHGRVENYRLHAGLRVHATDTLEAHDLNTVTEVGPELTFCVFLEGTVAMNLDDRHIELGDPEGPSAHMWSVARPAKSQRMSRKGTRIRKVLVSAPQEWYAQFLEDTNAETPHVRDFLNTHTSNFKWHPSNRVLALCEQILSPPTTPGIAHRLEVEGRAIEIIAEGLAALVGLNSKTDQPRATQRNITRARRIRSFIVDHLDDDLTLTQIGKEVGMSVESLQRAFKAAYGTTVVDFVREHRLHRARQAISQDGISISEAAYRAGYSNPANFSTAFKKLFGMTPSEAAK